METQRRHHTARAGNGTRTRDPNLGKVVLYQLSYSRERAERFRTATASVPAPNQRTHTATAPEVFRSDGGEGDRTPDLVNAIHALSQLSYAPGTVIDGGQPSGTAKYSHVYMACQRNGTSENIYGQYFAAPSKVVADLRCLSQILSDRDLSTVEMRRCTQGLVAAHRCLPRMRRKREAPHQ